MEGFPIMSMSLRAVLVAVLITASLLLRADGAVYGGELGMTLDDEAEFPLDLGELMLRTARGAAPAAGAKLQSKSYEEKDCPNVNPASNLKLKWITKIPAWYVPMASAHYYHTWVERLTNKSATGDDINNLCLHLLFLASSKPNQPYMIVAGGLKKSVIYKCLATGPHNQNCDAVVGAPDYAPGIDAYETIVATDNSHYILVLRCIRNKYKSWFVMSPFAESLTAEVKKIVVGHVNAMGFNAKFSSMIPYAACPKGTVDPRKG